MTHQAREVLADCRVAISKLQDGISGRDWRIAWVTAVSLQRAVGHVLRNVDAKSDPSVGEAIAAAERRLRESKPKPTIYWEFIK